MSHPDTILFQNTYRIRSTRLRGHDYTGAGSYYITICTKNRVPWFGKIEQQRMWLSDIGNIVDACWNEIPHHFPHVLLDQHIVMPNHMHGILCIVDRQQLSKETHESCVSTQHGGHRPLYRPAGSLGSIISQFKSVCTKQIRSFESDFAWQPRFHDRIIRDEQEKIRIRNYIMNNPVK